MFLIVKMSLSGDYYCLDTPAGLQNQILDELDISQTKYMGFYSTIQWASIVSCLFGGYMTDRVGNRICMVTSTVFLLFSHTMFSAGALFHSYWTMWVARALFGLVEGISAISVDNLTVKWYRMSVLNMVMGLRTSISRASSVLTLNILGPIYISLSRVFSSNASLCLALLSGSVVAAVSALAAILFALLDKRADKRKLEVAHKKSDANEHSETIKLSDIKEFPATFWLISFTTAVYYLQVFPFVAQGQVFMETKYERNPNSADSINSMIYLTAAITMPLFGFGIDKFGRNLMWLFGGLFFTLASHVLMTFTFTQPYLSTVLLGIGYSIVTTTVWPLVSYVIPLKQLGTAYGIMNTVIAVGQSGVTYLVGYIVDTTGFFMLEFFFLMSIITAIILASVLFLTDQSTDGGLNNSTRQRLDKENEKSLKQKAAQLYVNEKRKSE